MTAALTAEEISNALLGIEHAGHSSSIYAVNYAVGHKQFGNLGNKDGNYSGFTFGLAQLDIGKNANAQMAYFTVLSDALSAGQIDETTFARLSSYAGKSRYDLDPALAGSWKADKKTLDGLFSQDFAKPTIDLYDQLYIAGDLLPKVQTFVTKMQQHGTTSLFDPSHPDYAPAVSGVTAIANAHGNLHKELIRFTDKAPSLRDVHDQFITHKPISDKWPQALMGGKLMEDGSYPLLPDFKASIADVTSGSAINASTLTSTTPPATDTPAQPATAALSPDMLRALGMAQGIKLSTSITCDAYHEAPQPGTPSVPRHSLSEIAAYCR